MKRILGRGASAATGGLLAAAVCAAAAMTGPAVAGAATNTGMSSIPAPGGTLEVHATADCVQAQGRCFFNTQLNLQTPEGPIGFPGEFWARQTITVRSTDRSVFQEVSYSAPSGAPPETKGANINNVLSRSFKAVSGNEISVTYFGGGPLERFRTDGVAVQTDWATGKPTSEAGFILCSNVQVVYSGVNFTTPAACAQTTFS
jgi:hypothetical protein